MLALLHNQILILKVPILTHTEANEFIHLHVAVLGSCIIFKDQFEKHVNHYLVQPKHERKIYVRY